ncbi:unnamed protein product [Oppiella nova]|uniref:Uncharacterized protein n=1 Tax=Oppiella nova TaxID=334625 RepID=A0A7R9QT62_9ACAR|nr:unnamed protein product [Oppiella nova]CAG2174048.1 unnamed protein product [Oppiella nova]
MSHKLSVVLKCGYKIAINVDTDAVKTIHDLKAYLQARGIYCDESDKIVYNQQKYAHGQNVHSLFLMDGPGNNEYLVSSIGAKDEILIVNKSEPKSDYTESLSKEINDLKVELSALKASYDRIVCENQELRQNLNQLDISGSEEGSSVGKGSQNPMTRMTDILTQILNESQKTNTLMSGMNTERDKALKTLEGIRQLVGNTGTESTASTTPFKNSIQNSGYKLVINVDTDEVKTIKDLKRFLSGIYCEDTDKMIYIEHLMVGPKRDGYAISNIAYNDEIIFESKADPGSDQIDGLSKEMNDLRKELSALKASYDRIVCENQELRQKLNQMDISGSEEGSNDGKGSQNPMTRMTDILTQILNESQKTNSLMSGEKEKVLKTLESIRQLVGNTDTESTASTTPCLVKVNQFLPQESHELGIRFPNQVMVFARVVPLRKCSSALNDRPLKHLIIGSSIHLPQHLI